MCWIIWIYSSKTVVQEIYDWLTTLQHRGQDAAWIATIDWKKVHLATWNWLVRDVFSQEEILNLKWNIWIWHVRYPTAWSKWSIEEAQPFYVNSPFWITFAHNWNLTNTKKLAEEIFEQDLRHLNTSSDSEILLNVLAHEIAEIWKKQLSTDDIFNAVEQVHSRVRWWYAAISHINWQWLLAFRDPFAIRPICFWERENNQWWKDYIIASESVALDSLWFKLIRDIWPWEAIFIDLKWNLHSKVCHKNPKLNPCIFEHIYFARPDSLMDTISVYKARLRLWEALWKKIKKEYPNLEVDVVMPIPDTSRTTAIQLAKELDLPYREGFIKNRYIWRTFIMPGQEMRKKSIRQKLNPISLEFRNKNVLLLDDSIVRWNTSREIIKMARASGAKNVYFASAAPEIKYSNVYWIDMPTKAELISANMNSEELAKDIWADLVVFQDLEDLPWAIRGKKDIQNFEMSCFDWVYCTWDIDEEYLEELEKKVL